MNFDFTNQIKGKTNEELTEIFINAKDYNSEFVALAEEELINRNINVDSSKQIREKINQDSKQNLQTGKPGSSLYIFICFLLALAGGFLGIYAGYIYSQSKIKNSDGEEFFVYDEQTRNIGKIIMWLGIGVLLFFVLKFCFANN
jgi:hypothetical protein